jgi:hypothetical protein
MNLQEQISRIQSMMVTINEGSESRQDKLLNIINSAGLLQASLSVGGMERLINIVGDDNITIQNKIWFIKEVVMMTDREYIQPYDIDEEPIHVGEDDDGVITQIETLYGDSALLSIYEDYEDYDLETEYENINYESLPDQIIKEIFDIVLKYYNKYVK